MLGRAIPPTTRIVLVVDPHRSNDDSSNGTNAELVVRDDIVVLHRRCCWCLVTERTRPLDSVVVRNITDTQPTVTAAALAR